MFSIKSPSNGSNPSCSKCDRLASPSTDCSHTISVSPKQPSVPAGFDRVVSTDRLTGSCSSLQLKMIVKVQYRNQKQYIKNPEACFYIFITEVKERFSIPVDNILSVEDETGTEVARSTDYQWNQT
ncbi:hypothetical protein OYC64_005429 [Pagothenia borchgrevinki]|uniref:Uncharacterized protein n=1 Tax=Pagothenia borchgrevinki TaxID=8213 RepID=A0ABD2GGK6_PAGBO